MLEVHQDIVEAQIQVGPVGRNGPAGQLGVLLGILANHLEGDRVGPLHNTT